MASAIILAILLFLPYSVMAQFGSSNETGFWQDLTNNLATDLAPIIALFGEQTTKQFLSESTTILDTIVFAVGPLGIITAVVSCIRVAGNQFLKSFIGRAREPQAMAEIELCSSTSVNVSELWSNGGICRVFGRPRIFEFVYRETKDPSEFSPGVDSSGAEIPAKCGIESTREFFRHVQNGGSEPDSVTLQTMQQNWKAVSSHETLLFPLLGFFARRHRKTSKDKTNNTPKARGGVQAQNTPDLEKGDDPNPGTSSRRDQQQSQGQTRTPGQMTPGEAQNQSQIQAQPRDQNQPKPQIQGQTQPQGQYQTQIQVDNETQSQTTQSRTQGDGQGESGNRDRAEEFAPFPNMALNIGVQKTSNAMLFLWIASILGVAIQASFFGYATWAVKYNKKFYDDGDITSDPTFFILTVTGTVLLVVGMGLSANVIDRTSEERRFVTSDATGTRMYWLQPAGQRIGDQEFDGFAHDEMKTEYITSWMTDATNAAPQSRVWLAAVLSILGWAAQFVGLRGVHGSVSLYQLAVTIFMSILRAILRSHRNDPKNYLQGQNKDIEGHELDWQALQFANEIDPSFAKEEEVFWFMDNDIVAHDGSWLKLSDDCQIEITPNINAFLATKNNSQQMLRIIPQWIETRNSAYWSDGNEKMIEHVKNAISQQGESKGGCLQLASGLMRIRSRLALLTDQLPYQEWEGETRKVARQLKSALQKAAQLIFSAKLFIREYESVIWSTPCRATNGMDDTASASNTRICFQLIRTSDSWHIDEHHLEAVLGLWSWSFRRHLSKTKEKPETSRKLLAMPRWSSANLKVLFQHRWGLHLRELQGMSLPNGEFSNLSVPTIMSLRSAEAENDVAGSPAILAIDASSTILGLMAQDIFTIFLERLSLFVSLHLEDILYPELSMAAPRRASLIDDLAGLLVSEHLATTDEAIMTTVSGFYRNHDLLVPGYHLTFRLVSHANALKRQQKFGESERVIQGVLQTGLPDFDMLALRTLAEIHRSEWRWIVRQPLVMAEATDKVAFERMVKRWSDSSEEGLALALDVYTDVYECLDNLRKKPLGSRKTSSGSTGQTPLPNIRKHQPLDEKTLRSFKLDAKRRKGLQALALTLVERYDLGASTIEVRRSLLRWGIESDCTGLVEDLWTAEQDLEDGQSAFSGGSDELFWALELRTDEQDMMSTILFLVDVAQVPTVTRPILDEQGLKKWWATSRRRDDIEDGYKRLRSPLTVVSANNKADMELLQLLAQPTCEDSVGLHDAVIAALGTGNFETVNYLYSTITPLTGKQWPADALLEMLLTASSWGLKACVKRILSVFEGDMEKMKRMKTKGYLKLVEKALEIAEKGPREEDLQRAIDVFHSDKAGVVAFLRQQSQNLRQALEHNSRRGGDSG